MQLKNSEIIITVDDDKEEFRIGQDKKWRYFIRKIDLNDGKNSFGYNNKDTTIKIKNFENVYNIDFIMDSDINKRIILGKEKYTNKCNFYIFDMDEYILTLENEIYISDKNEEIEKVLIFKEFKIICIKTKYNIYFYSFDLKNIFKLTSSESNQIINSKIKTIYYRIDFDKKYIKIEIIEKKDEYKFFLSGYDRKYLDDSNDDSNNDDDNNSNNINAGDDNDDDDGSNSNNINTGDDNDDGNNNDGNSDDKSSSSSFYQENKSKSWIKIYNIIN